MVFRFGILSREQAIAMIDAAPPWAKFRLDAPRVIPLTADSAILTYRATARRAEEEPYAARMTTVFVNDGRSWKMAFHQQTPENAWTG